jgi:hypothetical protein
MHTCCHLGIIVHTDACNSVARLSYGCIIPRWLYMYFTRMCCLERKFCIKPLDQFKACLYIERLPFASAVRWCVVLCVMCVFCGCVLGTRRLMHESHSEVNIHDGADGGLELDIHHRHKGSNPYLQYFALMHNRFSVSHFSPLFFVFSLTLSLTFQFSCFLICVCFFPTYIILWLSSSSSSCRSPRCPVRSAWLSHF